MKASISHTLNLGICKLTFSRSGITVSSGIPGARVSLNTSGKAGVSIGVPGIKGLNYRKTKKVF